MDIASLIPVSDIIPVPWGWFKFLLIFTFVLHLLFMNVMLGTGIIMLVQSVYRRKQAIVATKKTGRNLTYTIAFTVNMGVAPFLFIQVLYGPMIYTSSILMAWYWLSIVGVLLIAYYSAYIYSFKFDTLGSLRVVFLSVSVILMLFIGFLFTNNMTLMLTPEKWTEYFTHPGGTLLNLAEPTIWPRYLHFVTASVSVGGLFLALRYQYQPNKGKADNPGKIAICMHWYTAATTLQILTGLWYFFLLPVEIRALFLGGSGVATLLLAAGIMGGAASLIFGVLKRIKSACISVLVTIIVMVIVRDIVRDAYLEPYFSVSDLSVSPQYTPLILFMVVFVLGLSIVAYMLKLALKTNRES